MNCFASLFAVEFGSVSDSAVLKSSSSLFNSRSSAAMEKRVRQCSACAPVHQRNAHVVKVVSSSCCPPGLNTSSCAMGSSW
eukprot:1320213-Amphidinium_carterae.2